MKAAAVAGAAFALVAGVTFGRPGADPHASATASESATAGTPGGCADAGPVLAAAQAVAALGGPRALDPRTRGAVIAGWAAEPFASRLAARLAAGDRDPLLTGLLDDLAAGRPAVTLVVPIAARVDACDERATTVRVWTMAVLGTARLGRLAASWSTETVQLVRERGDWRVANQVSAAGPVPVVAQPATPVAAVLAAAAGMTGVAE